MGSCRLAFAGFVLDPDSACLVREGTRIPLSPKDCALLHYLVTNPGRVISHAELLQAVWGDTAVAPDVLKVRIARIRRLLGDEAGTPRFIANVHGEGYRFLRRPGDPALAVSVGRSTPRRSVVGRHAEVDILHDTFASAVRGERQIVFVGGDAGIGKTTLIDLFIDGAGADGVGAWIGRGQCIEHYGSGEPYLPVLEALGRLGRDDADGGLKAILQRYAPSWLIHLPAILSPQEHEALQRRIVGPTRERMLRELAEALERFPMAPGGRSVIVLVFEDLHWADVSTLDLLRMLARRREQARVLILASYRPVEVTSQGHTLRGLLQEMNGRQGITQLRLGPLDEDDVSDYLEREFPGSAFPPRLASAIHQRTAGNPLFLNDVVRDLMARGVFAPSPAGWAFQGEVDAINAIMPASIRQLVARQREGLTAEDQRLLGAASVAGLEFSAAAVAAALGMEAVDVEEACLRLQDERRLLNVAGSEEWPDGTRSMRFSFLHALHRELWQERVSDGRRQEWHVRIAQRKEAAYGRRASDIASELAVHFEAGRAYSKAVSYYGYAARVALQRAANIEAEFHVARAFPLLEALPSAVERLQHELSLQIQRATLTALTSGYESPEARAAFAHAHETCRRAGDGPELLESAFGLCRALHFRGEVAKAREIGEQMQSMVRGGADPVRGMAAHLALGSVLLQQGEFRAAIETLTRAVETGRTHWRDDLIGAFASDIEVVSVGTLGNALQISGYPDQALRFIDAALRISDGRPHPLSRGGALFGASFFHYLQGNPAQIQSTVAPLRSPDCGQEFFSAFANLLGGWALAVEGQLDEGISRLAAGTEFVQRAGIALYEPLAFSLLADAYRRRGDFSRARSAAKTAVAAATCCGPGFYDAEMYRIEGEVYVACDDSQAAERSFRRAIDLAAHQGAKSWELRTDLSLAHLWCRHGRQQEARELVAKTYTWFNEGFDTPDLRAAYAFLAAAD